MNRPRTRLTLLAALAAVLPFLPALADTRIEKALKLDPGGKLTVVADAGSLTITGSASPGAHMVLTSDKADFESRFDLKLEELPGELRITLKKKESVTSWSGWFSNAKIAFDIQVPTKTTTQLRTGGGHVAIRALEGDATAETSGGHIEVRDLRGNLTAETSGGHIEVREARGRVDANTSGGHVEVAFAKGNAHGGKIESSGGGITVEVDPAVDLNIDASTSGGSVRTDIPIKVVGKLGGSSVRGTLGKGGESLYVHTSGGSVSIGALGGSN